MDVLRRLEAVHDATGYRAVLLSGSGTCAVEAMLSTLALRNQTTLVLANGVYGERMAEMLARQGKPARMLRAAWTAPIDLAAVERALDAEVAPVALPRALGPYAPVPCRARRRDAASAGGELVDAQCLPRAARRQLCADPRCAQGARLHHLCRARRVRRANLPHCHDGRDHRGGSGAACACARRGLREGACCLSTPRDAVILAAGRGVRLGELGLMRPKGFIDLGGRPIIERSLEYLTTMG